MNNKRPSLGESMLRSLLLSLAAMWILGQFFGWPGQPKPQNAERPANLTAMAEAPDALKKAFAGIDAAQGAPISEAAAKTEVAGLEKQIATNSSDAYSYWARLRVALLQQYLLKDMSGAFKHYNDIIAHAAHDPIDAQAIYQKGDWQWRKAVALETGAAKPLAKADPTALELSLHPSKQDAVWTLEQLIHRGRQAADFSSTEIFVPKLATSTAQSADQSTLLAQVPLEGVPSQGFEKRKIGELKGSLENPSPIGVLDRINAFYSTTTLNKGFDVLVNLFGSKPAYSYGLAIMLLAVLLRVIMQPINRRQYDSMKGMAAIAPEMKTIQEKYKAKPNDSPEVQRDKQMKMFQEVRALQKAHGVNPQMGCALAFVQLPVFFYIINPLMMHYEPKMELVGAHFLWIQSLAHPDYILLGLYGLSMLVSFRLSATPPTDDMQRQMQLMTTFIFPIMLPFFMKGFSSAFILYWMTFNFVSMIFQYRMMKASDPNKSVIKALIGEPLLPKVPDAAPEAVPPRPKNSAKTKNAKSAPPMTIIKKDEENGAVGKNGLNGQSKTALGNGEASLNGNGQNGHAPEDETSEALSSAEAKGRKDDGQKQRARRRRR
jgi:YidC/Oxa1 family membrane protein insertase